MLRSMYSGISGLKNFQTKLDVIGNNISNVNTYGFKKGRTVFKDLISQTVSGASAATATRGGVNPKQVGLGSQIAAIDTIHTGGSMQSTGRVLDLAISGDGFFQVADGNATSYGAKLFTRAGNFYMDNKGYLVNGDGKYLVGVADQAGAAAAGTTFTNAAAANAITSAVDGTNPAAAGNYQVKPIRIPTDAQSMSVGQDGVVTFVDSAGTLRYAGQVVLTKFSNSGGLEKVGANYFQESANSGVPFFAAATQQGMGSINSGFLEMSNVDLSEEFTEMIVAQRGFQANTRIITTSDEILQELVNLKR
ncbi:flagellar basal body rod protein FlgG [Paenisporosarcina cavernae]|uniref:Flagellar hook protein FlgE n=1 Tax=Paenisporosarcina cavernae TaxID=2320858 RepID=A0A385YTK2_9BACL|nr:flagellar basal body rod protein FlgG [Paenisporosarcina cavernae]AYC29247.1 flagellar basal body rod protein FlgG [Paenisporosarcina cavernae]